MTDEPKALIAAGAAIATIVTIAVTVVLNDSPARGAADISTPQPTGSAPPSTPQPYIRKPVEQAPPRTTIPGDGVWVVGRDLERGVYRSAGGRSCTWVRLRDGLDMPWTAATPPPLGSQVVFLGGPDVAFGSRGCARWVRIR